MSNTELALISIATFVGPIVVAGIFFKVYDFWYARKEKKLAAKRKNQIGYFSNESCKVCPKKCDLLYFNTYSLYLSQKLQEQLIEE